MLAKIFSVLLALSGVGLGSGSYAQEAAPQPTRVLDRATGQRLLANKGLTLQWIDWNTRGHVFVQRSGGVWTLRGAQAEAGGPGRLLLDGTISEIGRDHFIFRGKIRIADTPDRGRLCEQTKSWRFAITQRRKYYRLREFEWCDGLTDYIDIHF
jgi:hypothetical protein